jgi:deoxyribonuclease V
MIACVDVDYRDDHALAACVLLGGWADATPAEERTARIEEVAEYVPGQFYRRELPCLLAVLEPVRDRLSVVVVDGYVWLGDENTPGLGARLYAALGESVPVVGVAKTRFKDAAPVAEVTRGESANPLFVSAVGLPLEDAAAHVRALHGPYRLPTALKRVDTLCRQTPG